MSELSDIKIRLTINALATSSLASGALTLWRDGSLGAPMVTGLFVFSLCGFVLSSIDYAHLLRKS
jgi:hypothetical protein